jgi:hypothetical protein
MKADEAMQLLQVLGCSNIRPNMGNTWVGSTCPLAKWAHKGGIDKHPSFGISVHSDDKGEGESKFKCYTCNASGSLVGDNGLLQQIARRSKRPLPRMPGVGGGDLYLWTAIRNEVSAAQIEQKRQALTNVSGWKHPPGTALADVTGLDLTATAAAQLEEAPPPLSEAELARFTEPSPEVMKYLREERRLTHATIKRWELRWHEGARRIAIPIRDAKGNLVGISGRAFDGQRPKFLHSKGFRRDFYLYGERFNERDVPGYLTEGFFDVMFLQQEGINAFAIMGAYLSRVQVEKCTSMFTRVVIVPDGDEPGEEAAERIHARLGARMSVVTSPMATGKDPDDLNWEELAALKAL